MITRAKAWRRRLRGMSHSDPEVVRNTYIKARGGGWFIEVHERGVIVVQAEGGNPAMILSHGAAIDFANTLKAAVMDYQQNYQQR